MAEHVKKKSNRVSKSSVNVLLEMLRTRRPHNTPGEREFVETFLKPLELETDSFGNLYKSIGTSPVVWCSHVDTVHHVHGSQLISVSADYVVTLHPNSKSNCLGADDTAGVWLMMELIKAERPGLYIFHRGEECGTLGSRHLVAKTPELVKERKFIIALDRKGYSSVITRQTGGRCCSDEFANSLAAHMGGDYKIDTGGTVTDSAHYTDLIGECTNLSVGYLGQHWKDESLHVPHLCFVRERLLELDADKHLVFKREAGDTTGRYTYRSNTNFHGSDDYYNGHDYHGGNRGWKIDYDFYVPATFNGGYWLNGKYVPCTRVEWQAQRQKFLDGVKDGAKKVVSSVTTMPDRKETKDTPDELPDPDAELLSLVYMYPKTVARMFEGWGFDKECLVGCMADYAEEAFKVFHKVPVKVETKPVDKKDDTASREAADKAAADLRKLEEAGSNTQTTH